MTTCSVRGCARQAGNVFTYSTPEVPTLQWLVCDEHDLELKTYPFTSAGDAGQELLVGKEAPPYITNFRVTQGVGTAMTVELKLGHDGVPEQEITFMMTKDDYTQLGIFYG